MQPPTQRRAHPESGFAMLLVFLMAAVIGITLYMEIPRVAFDAQRQKELMLIERGEQYKRAIQLFVKKNSRYPGDIKELESFNNQRYLRHRYKDPITGKEEWRLVHVGPGGVFTDSLVNKPKTDPKASTYQNTFIAEGPAIGSQAATGQQAINPALRRRSSEGGTPTGLVLGPDGLPVLPQPQQPGTIPGQQPTLPGQAFAGFTGQTAGQPGIPGQPQYPGQPQFPGQTGIPGMPQIPGQIGAPGMPQLPGMPVVGSPAIRTSTPQQPGTPGTGSSSSGSYIATGTPYIGSSTPYIGSSTPYIGGTATTPTAANPTGAVRYPGMPGPPVNSQTGGVSPQPYPTTPGSQGYSPAFPQPGMTTGSQNEATRMIQQLLTTPRPGGIPSNNAGMQGMTLGGGIAGVASLSEDEGILIYNERSKYNEWEFIYDPTKEKRIANPNAAVIGTPADKLGSTPGSGSPGTGTPGFGGTSGVGGNSGAFGQSGSFGRRP